MTDDIRTELESFLVEDVILTLGNLRGSLSWLMATDIDTRSPRGIGIDRLDRQLALVEDRARSVCQLLRSARLAPEPWDTVVAHQVHPGPGSAHPRHAATPEPGVPLGTAIIDALLHDRDAGCLKTPLFRSQRAQS